MLKRLVPGAIVCAAAASWSLVVSGQQRAAARVPLAQEWPTYGHDPGGMRFSPVTQLTPGNVGQLQVAWVYHMKPPPAPGAPTPEAATAPPQGRGGRGNGSGFSSGETTPLVIN